MRTPYRISFVSRGSVARHGASQSAKSLLKTILFGAGLTLAAATPSFAQSYDPSIGTGNIVPYPQTAQSAVKQDASNAYARVAPRIPRGARKSFGRMDVGPSAWDAYNLQESIGGTDPDPNIRFQLNRESLQG